MTHLHDILGVSVSATEAEIKAAFRARARTAHPDKGGSAEEFNELRTAYQKLMAQMNGRCSVCCGKGFVNSRRGIFVYREPCSICWKTK